MSSNEIRITRDPEPLLSAERYTVRTGENVLIGRTAWWEGATHMACIFMNDRAGHPTISDSALVAKMVSDGRIAVPRTEVRP